MRDGGRVFAKSLADADAGLFEAEADGLSALRELGGIRVPAVVHVSPRAGFSSRRALRGTGGSQIAEI